MNLFSAIKAPKTTFFTLMCLFLCLPGCSRAPAGAEKADSPGNEQNKTGIISMLPNTEGFFTSWLALGPIPPEHNLYSSGTVRFLLDSDYPYDSESVFDLKGIAGLRNKTTNQVWRLVSSAGPKVDLEKAWRGFDGVAAYLYCRFNVSKKGPLLLHLGSDDGIKVWWNGKVVHKNVVNRPAVPDSDLVLVEAEEGENRCLLKVVDNVGDWGFYFKITDIHEKPFKDGIIQNLPAFYKKQNTKLKVDIPKPKLLIDRSVLLGNYLDLEFPESIPDDDGKIRVVLNPKASRPIGFSNVDIRLELLEDTHWDMTIRDTVERRIDINNLADPVVFELDPGPLTDGRYAIQVSGKTFIDGEESNVGFKAESSNKNYTIELDSVRKELLAEMGEFELKIGEMESIVLKHRKIPRAQQILIWAEGALEDFAVLKEKVPALNSNQEMEKMRRTIEAYRHVARPLMLQAWIMKYRGMESNDTDLAAEFEGARITDSLSGEWDFYPDRDNSGLDEIRRLDEESWAKCPVPAIWKEAEGLPDSWISGPAESNAALCPYAWYRLKLPPQEVLADRVVKIKIGAAKWVAEVWLNNSYLGKHVGGYAPFEFNLTDLLSKNADNTVLIRLTGWSAIPRTEDGVPLVLTGNSHLPWGIRAGGITGDVELIETGSCRISNIHVIPNIYENKADVDIWVENTGKNESSFEIRAAAVFKGKNEPSSPLITARGTAGPGETRKISVSVPIIGMQLWFPHKPDLYTLEAGLVSNEVKSDFLAVDFGMRNLEVFGNEIYLNNNNYYFMGSSLVGEASGHYNSKAANDENWIKSYIIDFPKKANMNVFRSHTEIPWRKWYEVCDREGMMIITELPNFPVPGWVNNEEYREVLEREFAEILPTIWNHPSNVMYSISNESWHDADDYETRELVPYVRGLDPSLPVMRAGNPGPDVADLHSYAGFWSGPRGAFDEEVVAFRDEHPDIPLFCTELLESGIKNTGFFEVGRGLRHYGPVYNDLSGTERADVSRELHAEFAREQIELLLIAGYSGVLPYWYSDWVNGWDWQHHPELAEPPRIDDTYYAVKNAFSMLAPYIRLSGRHLPAGESLGVEVWVKNSRGLVLDPDCEVLLISERPDGTGKFSPESIIYSDVFKLTVDPYSRNLKNVTLNIPETEGEYFIVARAKQPYFEGAMTWRRIWSVKKPEKALDGMSILTLGCSEDMNSWMAAHGAKVDDVFKSGRRSSINEYNKIIIGPGGAVSPDVLERTAVIGTAINYGVPLLVLEQKLWTIKELADVTPVKLGRSITSVFPAPGKTDDPRWAKFTERLMTRWNGDGERIADFALKVPNDSDSEVLLVGADDSTGFDVLALRKNVGKGGITFCQLKLADRISADSPMYDPAAEQLLLNFIKY